MKSNQSSVYDLLNYTVQDNLGNEIDLSSMDRVTMSKNVPTQEGQNVLYIWVGEVKGKTITTYVGTEFEGKKKFKRYKKDCLGFYHGKKPNIQFITEDQSARAQFSRMIREKTGNGYTFQNDIEILEDMVEDAKPSKPSSEKADTVN